MAAFDPSIALRRGESHSSGPVRRVDAHGDSQREIADGVHRTPPLAVSGGDGGGRNVLERLGARCPHPSRARNSKRGVVVLYHIIDRCRPALAVIDEKFCPVEG